MTTVRDIEQYLYAWAPRELAESWDNVGLLVGDPEAEVRRVLVALDVTPQVVAEAIEKRLPADRGTPSGDELCVEPGADSPHR